MIGLKGNGMIVYEAENHLLVCAQYSQPELHCHSAAHIIISLDDKIDMIVENEHKKCRGIMVPSRINHTANTNKNKVLIFLFDHTTTVANQIKTTSVLSDEVVEEIAKAYHDFEKSDTSNFSYQEFLKCVYNGIGIKEMKNIIIDKRIINALHYIQSNLHKTIICKEVAQYVFLSEGRFSHLFREQVGMTFSAYLIYQRVMKTYTKIIYGKSITEASIEAGFSSSAHFAEINKRLFGLSASMIKKGLTFSKIAEI